MSKIYKPSELLEIAKRDASAPLLYDYVDSIMLLRRRNWSYRHIARWLTVNGVPALFYQVYYVVRCYERERDECNG